MMGKTTSATEELRQMLDERGVEWEDHSDDDVRHTTWNRADCWFTEFPDGWTALGIAKRCTQAKAIEATLGRETCKLDPYTDVAFRVVQAAGDTDFIDSAEVCECSTCGASVIVPHEYERVTAGSDELWPKFNFCPSCGAEVCQ